MNQQLLSLDKTGVPFINVFPSYATAEQLGAPSYEEYVEQYLSTVKPRMISYDHYALLKDHDRPDYFYNMEVIRAKALAHGVPF